MKSLIRFPVNHVHGHLPVVTFLLRSSSFPVFILVDFVSAPSLIATSQFPCLFPRKLKVFSVSFYNYLDPFSQHCLLIFIDCVLPSFYPFLFSPTVSFSWYLKETNVQVSTALFIPRFPKRIWNWCYGWWIGRQNIWLLHVFIRIHFTAILP